MPAEIEYLLSLARQYIAGTSAAPDPHPDLDWSRFRALLVDLQVPSTFARLLDHERIPDLHRKELASLARRLHRRSACLLLELARLLPALEGAGCMPVLLKGAALGQTVYPNLADRYFADLDILVDRERFSQACDAAARCGYEAYRGGIHPLFFTRYHFHQGFRNPMGVHLELHWDLTRPDDYCRFDLGHFRDRTRTIEISDVPARIPANSDQLLHAACQAKGEAFSGLRRTLDAALLLKANLASETDLAARACRQGMSSPLWLLLHLTRQITRAEVSDDLMQAIRPAPLTRRCIMSLGILDHTLGEWGRRRSGYRALLSWLCAPDLRTTLGEMRRYLSTGESQLLAKGYSPDHLPGRLRRSLMAARQLWSLVKTVGYQGWRLASHGWGDAG